MIRKKQNTKLKKPQICYVKNNEVFVYIKKKKINEDINKKNTKIKRI